MKVVSWNVRRAKKDSSVWEFLSDMDFDIALLQEVGSMPENVKEKYEIKSKQAVTKSGKLQNFSTAVIVKGKIIEEISLSSEYDWVNKEIEFFNGNLVSCAVKLRDHGKFNVISVYSPAWPVDKNRLENIDVSPVKLKNNPEVWVTEILWSALKNMVSNNKRWIVGGDYNISETFDKKWQDDNRVKFGIRSSGNKEILDRMQKIGFTECLRKYNNEIIPTFKHSSGEIVHQIDHLHVTNNLYSELKKCGTGEQSKIFGESLSDHLPIIADFYH